VQAADITAGAGERRRLERERHTPGLDVIVANVAGWLLRAGESLGVDDFDAVLRRVGLLVDAYLEDKGRDFAAEVRARLLQFGSAVA
jgi:hypothetical protein